MARSDPLDSRQGPGKTEGQQRGRVQKGCAGTTVGDQRLEWRPVRSPPKKQSRVLFLGLPGAASLGRPPCWVKPVLVRLIPGSSVFMHNR